MISERTLLDLVDKAERVLKHVDGDSNRRFDVQVILSRLQKELNDVYGYRYAYRCDMKPVDDPRPQKR